MLKSTSPDTQTIAIIFGGGFLSRLKYQNAHD
jgi:hypothetical protein